MENQSQRMLVPSMIMIIFVASVLLSNSILVNKGNLSSIQQIPLDSTISLPITIDGKINSDEWNTVIRTHKLSYMLDVDNSGDPANVDGLNYIYTAEDRDNLYVGLDLCSDQTNDITGEWVGLWMITNEFDPQNDWNNWGRNVNKGIESLIYNVSGNQIMQFSNPLSTNNILTEIDNPSELTVSNGTTSDPISYLSNNYGDYYNVSSVSDGSQHLVKLDVILNASDWFEVFKEEQLNSVCNIQVYIRARHSQNIQNCKLILWDEQNNSPQPPYSNNDQVIALPTTTNFFDQSININPGNLSSNRLFRFSIWCNDSTSFNTSIDALYLYVERYSGSLANVNIHYAYSSINNFQIAWGFAASENNASNHRMFEIKIPKSELNEFGTNSNYKLLVGGYGTMSFVNTNYWVMPEFIYINVIDYSNYVTLSTRTFSDPSDFMLSSDAGDPDTDGEVRFTWTASENALSYALYYANEDITTINDKTILVASNIAETSKSVKFNQTGTYYAVVLAESYWGQKISNVLVIKVAINPETSPQSPIVSIDGFYGFILMILAFVAVDIFYKRRRIA